MFTYSEQFRTNALCATLILLAVVYVLAGLDIISGIFRIPCFVAFPIVVFVYIVREFIRMGTEK